MKLNKLDSIEKLDTGKLETINAKPQDRLIPLIIPLQGDHILYSPICGANSDYENMERLVGFQKPCISWCRRYLPIYTLNTSGKVIDIVFAVYPIMQEYHSYDRLKHSVQRYMERVGSGCYIESGNDRLFLYDFNREKGFIYYQNDLNLALRDYSYVRGIDLDNYAGHFVNQYPQSDKELAYRSSMKEICCLTPYQ